MDLIYTGAGNSRLAKIAIDSGFLFGAQLPGKVYHPVYFADQDWKKPNRKKYMQALAEHRPKIATVVDLESFEQLDEVLSWSEEASNFVEVVIIIPKVSGIIPLLPYKINNSEVRIGFSVPTSYGGTQVPIWEFQERGVHLLGGSPQSQMYISHYMETKSVDCNMFQKMATIYCKSWVPNKMNVGGYWLSLNQLDGYVWGKDAPYEAFRRSCVNIIQAWKELKGK